MWTFFHKLASPPHFYNIAPGFIRAFAVLGLLLIAWGTYAGLFVAPIDYQQKDAFRIIYVHVPTAYLSMMAYSIMAISAAIGLTGASLSSRSTRSTPSGLRSMR